MTYVSRLEEWGEEGHKWYTSTEYMDAEDPTEFRYRDEQDHEINERLSKGVDDIRYRILSWSGQDAEQVHEYVDKNLPKLVYEWCRFHDCDVTYTKVDDEFDDLMTFVLAHFHDHIVEDEVPWDVEDMLPAIRAVRSRLHPNKYYNDEYG